MRSKKNVWMLWLMLFVWSGSAVSQAKDFVLPKGKDIALWEAEDAELKGAWEKIEHPWASKDAYVKPKSVKERYILFASDVEEEKTLLEFPFKVEKPTTIKVYPVWWRHGERKVARPFPAPLPRELGPSVIDYYQNLVFFSAPAAGKVGIFDVDSETFLTPLEIGGYVPDLIINRDTKKLYVADAQNDKILVFDPETQKKTGELKLKVDSTPWSIALEEGRLYVACRSRKHKLITVISPEQSMEKVDFSLDKFKKRNSLTFKGKEISVDDKLTIQVGDKWFDATKVCDWQLLPQQALLSGDLLGTITFSMDQGPEYDWIRDIWITPEHGLYLVNGSERFERYNAISFALKPGKHILYVRPSDNFTQIDALKINRTLEDQVEVKILPQPEDIHKGITSPSYQAVFYYNEPVQFKIELSNNKTSMPEKVNLSYAIYNYMDELMKFGKRDLSLVSGKVWNEIITVDLPDYGRHKIKLSLESDNGSLVKEKWLLRLPKLEYPRLFFRKENIPAIKARLDKYPKLFERFNSCLREKCLEEVVQEKRLGKGFLPKSLTNADIGCRNSCIGWRLMACQFADMFLNPSNDSFFKEKLAPLFMKEKPPGYTMFHSWAPLDPGIEVSFLDMEAMNDEEMRGKIQELFEEDIGRIGALPWTILALKEPLTAKERAILSNIMMWEVNAENYFDVHCGNRGGTRWLNWRTSCGCSIRGWQLTLLYLSNLFGEKGFFDKKHMSGYLTYHDYLTHGLPASYQIFGSGVGPGTNWGHPLFGTGRWLLACPAKHPLELKISYDWWDEMVKELQKDKLTESEIKEIFSKKSPYDDGTKRYMWRCPPYEDTTEELLVMPIALGLGWWEPNLPKVDWSELPPTTVFDSEGVVSMRSDWGPTATEIYFYSGIQDMNYRDRPTDFQITKSGKLLFGTGSFGYDDGAVMPWWGNVVTIGSDWQKTWAAGTYLLRDDNKLINLSWSPMVGEKSLRYNSRDARLFGYYAPGGGSEAAQIGFHSHWPHLFVKQAEIIAYETWPEFDYAAGDAANVWPVEDVSEVYRQILFLKPDIVIIYDLVRLLSDIENSWLATTAEGLSVEGNKFYLKNKPAFLEGKVLLPEKIVMENIDPLSSPKFNYWFKRTRLKQCVFEIKPAGSKRNIEYLIVMRIGEEEVQSVKFEPKLVSEKDLVGTEFSNRERDVKVLFRKNGPVGGHITVTGGERQIDREFVQKIDDSYRHWSQDSRFEKWMKESRFNFVIPEEDRKKFGK